MVQCHGPCGHPISSACRHISGPFDSKPQGACRVWGILEWLQRSPACVSSGQEYYSGAVHVFHSKRLDTPDKTWQLWSSLQNRNHMQSLQVQQDFEQTLYSSVSPLFQQALYFCWVEALNWRSVCIVDIYRSLSDQLYSSTHWYSSCSNYVRTELSRDPSTSPNILSSCTGRDLRV